MSLQTMLGGIGGGRSLGEAGREDEWYVGNNIESGGVGESVLSTQLFIISQLDLYTLLQLWETAYIRYCV